MFNCSTLNISALMSWCKLQVMLIHFNCAGLIPQFSLSFSLCVCVSWLKAPDSTSGVISKTIDICLHKEGNSFGFVMRGICHLKKPITVCFFMVMHLVRSNILVKWCHLHYIELLATYCKAAVPIFIRKEFCLCLVNIWIN